MGKGNDGCLYRLSGGSVEALPISKPQWLAENRVVVTPGPPLLPIVPSIVERCAVEAHRVAPWAVVHLAADVWSLRDGESGSGDSYGEWMPPADRRTDRHGREWYRLGGRGNSEAAVVNLFRPFRALETLHHELWHVVSPHLDEEHREAVYAATREAVVLGNGYADGDEERAARLYEHYAVACLHGLPMGPTLAPSTRGLQADLVVEILQAIARGTYFTR